MPVVFCMSSRKLSKPLSAWGWHVCLQEWTWARCTPSPTRAFWTPAVQQDHAAFGQGYFAGSSTPARTWEPLTGQAFPSRWLSGSSCVTAWCIEPLLSLKLRSSSVVMPSPLICRNVTKWVVSSVHWGSSWLAGLWCWLSLLCNIITIANAAG